MRNGWVPAFVSFPFPVSGLGSGGFPLSDQTQVCWSATLNALTNKDGYDDACTLKANAT